MTCGEVVQSVVMTEIMTTILLRMMWVPQESVENVKYRRKMEASGPENQVLILCSLIFAVKYACK